MGEITAAFNCSCCCQLDIIIRILSPNAIVIATPTFGMYNFLGKLQRAKILDAGRE